MWVEIGPHEKSYQESNFRKTHQFRIQRDPQKSLGLTEPVAHRHQVAPTPHEKLPRRRPADQSKCHRRHPLESW
ncbi:unnamed protein product [Heligmosomoides polygyrus]|uniref:Uncharacterized protein n=1 Tax=Heligmosomoides polygyrus TaxID=6339 RepID=A0A183GL52_HELPZ|nr:unnamed protein product [Heligmosomoides polygyrus]